MFERIKQFKKLSEEIKNLSREREKELGGNVLEICVADDGDFLSPYSPTGSPLISGEIAEFIDHNVKRLDPSEKMKIVIKSDCISDDEKPVYENAVKNYYHAEFLQAARGLKRNTVLTVAMTITAAIIFALAVVLDKLSVDSVILNMIDVVAWVFMWEAADIFFFRRNELKLNRIRAFNVIRSEIIFEKLK